MSLMTGMRDASALDTGAIEQLRVVSSGRWPRRYSQILAWVDLAVIVWAVAGAYFVRWGFEERTITVGGGFFPSVPLTYFWIAPALAVAWWVSLAVTDSRQPRILGAGPDEYKRIVRASFAVFGGFAIIAFFMKADIARGFLGVAFPAGVLGLLIARALMRDIIRTRRKAGFSSHRALVVGSETHVTRLVDELNARPEAGYQVVGVCLDDPSNTNKVLDVPVLGGISDCLNMLQASGANALVVTASDRMGANELQHLGWELAETDAELIFSPSLTSVAGPRIHMRPVSGLPLIHVEDPRLPRSGRLMKGAFDRLGAGLLILMLAPIFIGVTLAVKLTSKGPALFFQERIGENGRPFKVFKFRSMIVNADAQLKELLEKQGASDTPLFKPENDPRITPVGHFIRKYSLDELPQLFNVLFGTMSLVGPRPQRAAEVELYTNGAERRLLCKPGMTGLWQVSGRSDMPWERAMRLDLYYVENWSFMFDLLLLWRTIGVVVAGSGAR